MTITEKQQAIIAACDMFISGKISEDALFEMLNKIRHDYNNQLVVETYTATELSNVTYTK